MADFFIGTSGFSYKDWAGEFYPESLKSNEYLGFYCRYFNTVEINSTYYKPPDPDLFNSLLKKISVNFIFSCKAHSSMTHDRNADDTVYSNFISALKPLIKSGNFGVLLFQFPYSFYFNSINLGYIEKIKEKFKETDVVCEFRNSGWLNDRTFSLLEKLNIGFCNVDEPKLPKLLPATNILTNDIFYLRFHGRNAQKWWNCTEAFERYDYMYTEEELNEWIPKIKEASNKSKKILIYFNNHYKAKAAKSAQMLISLLDIKKIQKELPMIESIVNKK